jgi:hypothetical protein
MLSNGINAFQYAYPHRDQEGGNRGDDERNNPNPPLPPPPTPPLPPPPDPLSIENERVFEYKRKWEENVKLLRICEKARGPSGGITIPHGMLGEWVKQLTDAIMEFTDDRGKNMPQACNDLKKVFDSWRDGTFTYLAETEVRRSIDDIFTDRMQAIYHLPHPFYCQCYFRGCIYNTESPKELEDPMTLVHGQKPCHLANCVIEAKIQVYGEDYAWERESTTYLMGVPKVTTTIVSKDNWQETYHCFWQNCNTTLDSRDTLERHIRAAHMNDKARAWKAGIRRAVKNLSPIWKALVCHEIGRKSYRDKQISSLRVKNVLHQQEFATCLIEAQGEPCNAVVTPKE